MEILRTTDIMMIAMDVRVKMRANKEAGSRYNQIQNKCLAEITKSVKKYRNGIETRTRTLRASGGVFVLTFQRLAERENHTVLYRKESLPMLERTKVFRYNAVV